jgi:hypothetical protein
LKPISRAGDKEAVLLCGILSGVDLQNCYLQAILHASEILCLFASRFHIFVSLIVMYGAMPLSDSGSHPSWCHGGCNRLEKSLLGLAT